MRFFGAVIQQKIANVYDLDEFNEKLIKRLLKYLSICRIANVFSILSNCCKNSL